jgi:hypothetical protein
MIRGVPVSVWLLRAVVAAGPVVAVLAPAPQGYQPSAKVVVAVLLTGVAWAFAPDHFAGGLSLLIVLVWWMSVVGEALPLASVVAAAGFVASHAAATVLGYGPARARLEPHLVVTWARRAAMVWPAALVIWLVADVYSGHATPTSFWLLGLGAALVGALLAALWIPIRGSGRR